MGKIVCGICSFGMSGRVFHAPLIEAHPDFKLKAVLERTKNEAEKIYPDIITYRNYEDLLNDDEIDLIIVNLPDHLHFSFCMQALEAGKHIVVEKPFTLTVDEGERLINQADDLGLKIFVYQNRRWDSDFLTVKQVIESGDLGRIVEFEAHYDRFRPDPPKDTWKEDEKLGPGLLYNLGAHLIDQSLVLFGWPEAVYAEIRKIREGTGIVDYFNISLYYPSLTAILKSSYIVKHSPAKYIIHGDKGSFIKTGSDPQEERLKNGWAADDPNIGKEPSGSWGRIFLENNDEERHLVKSLSGNYMQFYTDVFDELSGKSQNAVSSKEGLEVIRIIEAAMESNLQGRKIQPG